MRSLTIWFGMAALSCAICSHPANAVPLPIDPNIPEHQWRLTLRNWLASFSTSASVFDLNLTALENLDGSRPFERPLIELGMQASNPSDRRHMMGIWLLEGLRKPWLRNWLNPPDDYLLSRIEGDPAGIRTPRPGAMPSDSFIATWDYPGNPFYDITTPEHAALMRRAQMLTAVDLIMLADFIEKGNLGTSTRIGHLSSIATRYMDFRDELPAAVRAAFQEGIMVVDEAYHALNPGYQQADIGIIAVRGMWQAYLSMDSPADQGVALQYYLDHATSVLAGIRRSGLCNDMSGADWGYQGICDEAWIELAMTEPARNPLLQQIHDVIRKSYEVRAYSVITDFDGLHFGTSARNSRTNFTPVKTEWSAFHRELSATTITDAAWPFVPSSRSAGGSWDQRDFPTDHQLENTSQITVGGFNRQVDMGYPATWLWPQTAGYLRFDRQPSALVKRFLAGEIDPWARWEQVAATEADLLRLPSERWETGVRVFDGESVVFNVGAFYGGIHTGAVGARERYDANDPSGGGQPRGSRSGVAWMGTRTGGLLSLAMRRGHNNPNQNWWSEDQQLEVVKRPVAETLLGVATASGTSYTSSSRIRDASPVVDQKGALAVEVELSGDIPDSNNQYARNDQILTLPVPWAQQIDVDAHRMKITTQVGAGHPNDLLDLAVEKLPLFLNHHYLQPDPDAYSRISITTSSGARIPVTTAASRDVAYPGGPQSLVTFHDDVIGVTIRRNRGGMQITFDQPQRVGFTDPWRNYSAQISTEEPFASETDGRRWREMSIGMLIDLLDGGSQTVPQQLTGKTVVYTIRPLQPVPACGLGFEVVGALVFCVAARRRRLFGKGANRALA